MDCYKEDFAKVCYQCGAYVDGQYYEADERNFHTNCIEKYKASKGLA